MSSIADIASRFASVAPACVHWTVRVQRRRGESLSVTRGVVDPIGLSDDLGVMVTVYADGAFGYAATSDVTTSGLAHAGREARAWAARASGRAIAVPVPRRAVPVTHDAEA